MLNTASAAFSHREGSMVTRVAVQSRGPRNTHRGNLPPAGQPRHMHVCGCVLAYADKRLTTRITYTHTTHSSPCNGQQRVGGWGHSSPQQERRCWQGTQPGSRQSKHGTNRSSNVHTWQRADALELNARSDPEHGKGVKASTRR